MTTLNAQRVLKKAQKIREGCTTPEQLETAQRWLDNAMRYLGYAGQDVIWYAVRPIAWPLSSGKTRYGFR